MGPEVELGVGSDTGTLQDESKGRDEDDVVFALSSLARARHRSRRVSFAAMLFAFSLTISSCGKGGAEGQDAGPSSVTRAETLVAGGAMPERFEGVALADAVALAATQERLQGGDSARAAQLYRLGGDLRARLYRLDGVASDAREALELYAEAARLQTGTGAACEADRARALLAGELANDAKVSYRELYLASRRQAASRAKAGEGKAAEDLERCMGRLNMALAEAVAYRPSGEAMAALTREGNAAAEALGREQVAGGASAATPTGSAAELAVAASAEPVAKASVAEVSADGIVVTPRPESISKDPVKLSSIEPYGTEQGGRVVLQLSGPAAFEVGTLAADADSGKDARVFVDIAHASAKGIKREIPVGGVVRRVRVGAQPKGTRVVLDLSSQLYRRIFYLPDPFRIVVDVSTRAPMREDPKAENGPRTLRRVAIDPGHGGNDSGAVGPTGLREKDITLDIAHRVAPLLAHELQVETLLTRDNDSYVPLDLRTARANAFHADLFVSIHCNASENGKATGVQSFILDRVRDPEGFAARVAARENLSSNKSGEAASQDEIALVLSNLNIGAMVERSRHVAELLQRATLASLKPRYPDTKDQGVKTAGFFVLVGADMPAVLFETAFISNTQEEGRLSTADYRQKLADAIVNAIRAYKEGK